MIKETFTYSHGIKVNLTFSKDQDIEVLIANEEGIYPQKGERQRIHQIYSSEARSIVLSIIPIEHLIINSLGECIPILTNKETSDILELDLSINEVLYKGIINKKEIQKNLHWWSKLLEPRSKNIHHFRLYTRLKHTKKTWSILQVFLFLY